MLTTYYDTRSVSGNTYVSKGQLFPYTSGTSLNNAFVLQTSISNYKTNALIDAALALKLSITTYNSEKSTFLVATSLTPYRTSIN